MGRGKRTEGTGSRRKDLGDGDTNQKKKIRSFSLGNNLLKRAWPGHQVGITWDRHPQCVWIEQAAGHRCFYN